MLIATGQLTLLADFLQILCWIILPLLLVTSLATVIHHRFKRKRNAAEASTGDEPFNPSKEPAADYLLFDHTGLIRQYKNKLSYSHARYRALEQDYENLRKKYSTIDVTGVNQSSHLKNNQMENTNEQLQTAIGKMTSDFAEEKKELLARLEELDRSYRSLEKENESLLEQVNLQSYTDDEKQVIINRWAGENKQLKEQVAEQLYLRDVVEEKKAQVDFLQTQLEQRIRKHHETERAKEQVSFALEALQEVQHQFDAEKERLHAEISNKQEGIEALQHTISVKENELAEKMQVIRQKEEHIIYAESQLTEVKQQNELLNAAVADSRELADALNRQLQDEQSKVIAAEQKLQANKQLLQRLYKEFSMCIEEDSKNSPVVAFRPAYLSSVAEEY
jgi:chromosome segregation ATPase